MRLALILFATCAFGQQSNTTARNPLYAPGGVACSATVTANCVVKTDASGNAKIGTTVLPLGAVDVRSKGAVGDGVIFLDGVISSGSTTFTSNSSTFTSADVGKRIQVYGAGGTTAITPATFVGVSVSGGGPTTSLSTMTSGGTYTGTASLGYCVWITATDTFKWGTYANPTYPTTTTCGNGGTGVTITGSAQTLSNGVTVTFGATTGYATNTFWVFSANPGVLATTIAGVTDSHTVTLAAAATATIASGGKGAYGTDNATAISAALAAIPSGGTVYFPAGKYLTSTATLVHSSFTTLAGDPSGLSEVIYAGSGAVTGAVEFVGTSPAVACAGSTQCLWNIGVRDLSIRGNAYATSALQLQAAHHAHMDNVRLADATNCYTSQFSVLGTFRRMVCSGNLSQGVANAGFLFIPTNGFVLDGFPTNLSSTTTTGAWTGTIAERVLGTGVKLMASMTNVFTAGTSEGNGIGVSTQSAGAGYPASIHDVIDSVDLEVNGIDQIDYAPAGNTVWRNIPTIPYTYLNAVYLPNNTPIYSKTTTGVTVPLIQTTSGNVLYIGSTAMVGGTTLNSGNNTYSFPGTGAATFSGTVNPAKGAVLPTSCTGLASGVLYNNGGTPAICP